MTDAEVKQPFRLVKIARNINAFVTAYEYIDEQSKWKFWSDLRAKIFELLKTLKPAEISIIKELTNKDKQKYFALCQ